MNGWWRTLLVFAGCLGGAFVLGQVLNGAAPADHTTPRLDIETTTYSPYPLAYANAFQRQHVPDFTAKVANPGDQPVQIRVTSLYDGYSYPAINQTTVNPHQSVRISQTIIWEWSKISALNAQTNLNLHYSVSYLDGTTWRVAVDQAKAVRVMPKDVAVLWMTDDHGILNPTRDYLATLVMPQDPYVRELVGVARSYAPSGALPGYQCGKCTDDEWTAYTGEQVKAIYDALQQHYGVSYAEMSTTFNTAGSQSQHVNLPSQALQQGSANCLDGTLLFASAMEAIGLNPYVIIIPGHAFVAFDPKPNSAAVIVVETTMVHSYSYQEATDKGYDEYTAVMSKLQDPSATTYRMMDIRALHNRGFIPLPA